jgi:putative salt-induced outer membrane protein YdiY
MSENLLTMTTLILSFARRSSVTAIGASALVVLASTALAQVPEGVTAEPPTWATTASAGLTLTQGNSDTLLVTADIQSAKDWADNEARLGASAAYGESQNVRNNESIQAFGQYNRLFNERLFGYLRLDAMRDAIADIDYRFAASPGLGYYFIRSPRTSLSGELGPGYIYEKQGGQTSDYFTLRLAERFEYKLSDTARIWQSAEVLPQVDDFENFIINAELGVETKLTQKLSLRTFAVNTYDNEPAPGRRRNDLKLVTAIAYTF